MGGRRDIKQKNGKNLKLSSPAEWYNEARYNLRKNMPGDIIYEKRDLFKALPDHVLRKSIPRVYKHKMEFFISDPPTMKQILYDMGHETVIRWPF